MKNKISILLFLAIIQTTNAQWSNIPSPYGGNFWAIKFFDANNGYIGGNTAILKTTDGGDTWTSTSISNFMINSLAFPSATVGYYGANNNIVAKTTNKGVSWVNQNPNASPYRIIALSFPSVTVGYAVGDVGLIRKTIDGGTTWTTQTSGTSSGLEEVHFFDVNTGICVGQSGKIRRTTNGGASWSTISSGVTDNLYDIFFVDANTGFIAGANGKILKTINGGLSWSILTTGITGWFYSICFKNTLEGYAGGAQGILYKTVDGGTTWQSVVSGVSSVKEIQDIVYHNNRFIAVTTQGNIITDVNNLGVNDHTTNEAELIVYPNPASHVFTVDFTNTESGPVTVTISTINGAVVKSEVLQANQKKVNVADLSNGVYIVEIKTEKTSIRKKLIVKK